MKHRRSGSEAMLYSLSEFSYILLFLAVGAATLLYGRYETVERRNRELAASNTELRAQVDELKVEVDFLNELLAEKKYGVVPCWRRPEGVIPRVAGTITIVMSSEFTIYRAACGKSITVHPSYDDREALLERTIAGLFEQDLAYAREKNCYIRMSIENRTGSFHIYSDVLSVLSSLGIVVANQ